MKRSYSLLIVAMLCAAHTAQAREKDTIIQFKRGHISAVMTDEIKGFNRTYVFSARKGQKATVTLTPIGGDERQLGFSLYSYCGEEFGQTMVIESQSWRGILPCTDKYSIDVSPNQDSIKNNYRLKYSLKVKIQ